MVTIGEGNSYEHPESWISKHTTEKNNLNMIEHEQAFEFQGKNEKILIYARTHED
jgi:hypothetical protein